MSPSRPRPNDARVLAPPCRLIRLDRLSSGAVGRVCCALDSATAQTFLDGLEKRRRDAVAWARARHSALPLKLRTRLGWFREKRVFTRAGCAACRDAEAPRDAWRLCVFADAGGAPAPDLRLGAEVRLALRAKAFFNAASGDGGLSLALYGVKASREVGPCACC